MRSRLTAAAMPRKRCGANPPATEAIVGRKLTGTRHKPIVRPPPALMRRLLNLHKSIAQFAHDAPDILEQSEVVRALKEKLIHLMELCLAEGVMAGVLARQGLRLRSPSCGMACQYSAAQSTSTATCWRMRPSERHRATARGVQATNQCADRVAISEHHGHVVLGFARFRPDQHAQGRWLETSPQSTSISELTSLRN